MVEPLHVELDLSQVEMLHPVDHNILENAEVSVLSDLMMAVPQIPLSLAISFERLEDLRKHHLLEAVLIVVPRQLTPLHYVLPMLHHSREPVHRYYLRANHSSSLIGDGLEPENKVARLPLDMHLDVRIAEDLALLAGDGQREDALPHQCLAVPVVGHSLESLLLGVDLQGSEDAPEQLLIALVQQRCNLKLHHRVVLDSLLLVNSEGLEHLPHEGHLSRVFVALDNPRIDHLGAKHIEEKESSSH